MDADQQGGNLPFPAEAFARFFANPFQQAWGGMQRNTPMPHEPDLGPPPATPAPADRPMTADQEELASLRKEIEDLKTVVSKSGKTRKKR